MANVRLIILAAFVACSFALPSYVIKFESERNAVRLQTYKFSNCLPADKEVMVINSLTFMPDPLVFPGPLNVSFDLNIKENVAAPLKGVLYIGKKVGSTWVKIPCIGNIGSCAYDDVCSLLSQIEQCPDPFVAAGIPCQCPFKKNSYKLPVASFDVESALFPAGDYHLQANLTYNHNTVGCYDILATFG